MMDLNHWRRDDEPEDPTTPLPEVSRAALASLPEHDVEEAHFSSGDVGVTEDGRPVGRISALLAVAVVFALTLWGPPAWANPDEEESEFAVDLVQQAISLIANRGGADRALEKMEDALEAPDPSGVDLALVQQAATVVEEAAPGAAREESLAQSRQILLQAAPALNEPSPVAMTGGLMTGTTVVLDDLTPARGISDGGDIVLLVLAAASAGLGLYLARLWRPHHSLRQLRARGARKGVA
ncbi:hypothetical protein V5H98_07650 [Georgenia sp. M64]|uniref:hypothetical protein n=1 Tax=Georgenia sp. M64 TaxID=3120520 RepID=UPI0030E0BCB9